jgi:hypothetical protein
MLGWNHKRHPRYDTGVDGPCPLARVPLFDLVWDVCMDFMHMVKVILAGHLLPLFKSQRGLTPPQVKANAANDPEIRRYCSRYNRDFTVITVLLQLQPSQHGYNHHSFIGRHLLSGESIARCVVSKYHGS